MATTITMTDLPDGVQAGDYLLIQEALDVRSGRSRFEMADGPAPHNTNLHSGRVVSGPLQGDANTNRAYHRYVGRVRRIRGDKAVVELLTTSEVCQSQEVDAWLQQAYGLRIGQFGQHHAWVLPNN